MVERVDEGGEERKQWPSSLVVAAAEQPFVGVPEMGEEAAAQEQDLE